MLLIPCFMAKWIDDELAGACHDVIIFFQVELLILYQDTR